MKQLFKQAHFSGRSFQPLLKNMKVNWDDSSQYMEKYKHVPNHQVIVDQSNFGLETRGAESQLEALAWHLRWLQRCWKSRPKTGPHCDRQGYMEWTFTALGWPLWCPQVVTTCGRILQSHRSAGRSCRSVARGHHEKMHAMIKMVCAGGVIGSKCCCYSCICCINSKMQQNTYNFQSKCKVFVQPSIAFAAAYFGP